MFYPDFQQFKILAKKGNLIPVYQEIPGDIETPVSAFLKITDCLKEKYVYLLESVERGEKLGRYSFLSTGSSYIFEKKIENGDNPLKELKKLLSRYRPVYLSGMPRFWGGAVGYLSYDYVRCLEKLPQKTVDRLNLPDCLFLFTDNLIIFDHILQTIKVVSCIFLGDEFTSGKAEGNIEKKYAEGCQKIENLVSKLRKPLADWKNLFRIEKEGRQSLQRKENREEVITSIGTNFSKKSFLRVVKKAKEYIREGEIIQVVLSQQFRKKIRGNHLKRLRPEGLSPKGNHLNCPAFDIYRALRTVNPSPYMFFLKFDDFYLVGSSPEILVRKEGKNVEVRPIAGTRPRGKNEKEDKKLEKNLLESPKERAEHIMLVDLGRNDLGRVCEYQSIQVPELMVVEKYSHVMHLVSSVIGKLRKNENAFSLLEACFPAGTVTGAPKIRAMEIIEELEPVRRGPYAGAIGYFSYQGNMDMAIIIRTILVKDNYAYIQAGAGIVADSSPEREYQETKNKAAALFKAIELTEQR